MEPVELVNPLVYDKILHNVCAGCFRAKEHEGMKRVRVANLIHDDEERHELEFMHGAGRGGGMTVTR